MILVVGPSGVGKTLLLKQLEESTKNSDNISKKRDKEQIETKLGSSQSFTQTREKVPATVPTIGSNICTVNYGRKKPINLREVGGSMGLLWKSYYKDTDKVIYVIDISNPYQVASSTIRLIEMLAAKELENTPFLVLLNKIDCYSTVTPVEMKSLLQLENIAKHSSQTIRVVDTSVKYGSGLQECLNWMFEDP